LRHERESVGVVLPTWCPIRRVAVRSIGLDVHKHFAEVAVIPDGGRQVRRGERIKATPAALRGFAETLGPDDQVVLEATMNTWAIADLLQAHAGRVVVSNPMRTRAIADAKVKTDRVDAAVLANCWPPTSSRRCGPRTS
jgi:transposase